MEEEESGGGVSGHFALAHMVLVKARELRFSSEYDLNAIHLAGAMYYSAARHDAQQQDAARAVRELIDATPDAAECQRAVHLLDIHHKTIDENAELLAKIAHYVRFAQAAYSLTAAEAMLSCGLGSSLLDSDFVCFEPVAQNGMPAYFVVLEVGGVVRRCVIAIRGTKEWNDVCADLTFDTAELLDGRAHRGVLQAARALQLTLEERLLDLLDADVVDELVVTGHSLGGAIAMTLALLLRTSSERTDTFVVANTSCVAVSPAPCVSENLLERCKSFTASLVLGFDVVPRLSATSLERMLARLAESEWEGDAKLSIEAALQSYVPARVRSTVATATLSLTERYLAARFRAERKQQGSPPSPPPQLPGPAAHGCSPATSSPRARCQSSVEHVEMHVGGRIFHLRHFCQPDLVFLSEIDAKTLLDIVPSFYKLRDHRTESIIDALQLALARTY
ncbi:Sn1-specific diacylglycerol lipase beta [Porphyridium purpureum]|uniref:Sn1-specific diacylglycerol lipase beta n=1 Tax=Porphyridium purpureum TaxID=35688 RepID=A0A5J4YP25_PORPP|nr:Sn1-specific diacylglycerol lipase beta [Porphyridium purpureum]|eukprot:POR7356..scf296_7